MILVILAGGRGLRLRPLTNKIPKSMININGKPFLERLILNFAKYNLKKIYILTGYRYRKIHNKFDDIFINGVKIKCINEKKVMGTGGALFNLKKIIKESFFLINGDTFLNINLNKLYTKINKNNFGYIFLVKKNKNMNNNLSLDYNKKIFFKNNSNYTSSGLYFFNKKIFQYIKNKYASLERDILPNLIKKKYISGKKNISYFIDIDSQTDLKKFVKKDNTKKKVIFLDRDGVINEDKGYTHKIKNFQFKKKIIKFLIKHKKNYLFFIVTNQSGIGRGLYDIDDFCRFHRYMKTRLSKNEIYIYDLEYCPHHPKAKIKVFKKKCNCRKPKNLMFKKLNIRWNLDKKKSFMVGDKLSDKIFAIKSGISFRYYSSI